jgi:FMN phosphatase YigB (HAD superfamily)
VVGRDEIRVVLFDVGGVLTVDPWQTLVLTPARGIADRLGLDRVRAAEVAERLWDHHAKQPDADESDYWREFGDALGVSIPEGLVGSIERELLRVNPEATKLLTTLASRGTRIGAVSDNTAFWYERQARVVGLDQAADRTLLFLSFQLGVAKKDVPGLFEIAADTVPPGNTLVLEDRAENVARAGALGFKVIRYESTWESSLFAAVMER